MDEHSSLSTTQQHTHTPDRWTQATVRLGSCQLQCPPLFQESHPAVHPAPVRANTNRKYGCVRHSCHIKQRAMPSAFSGVTPSSAPSSYKCVSVNGCVCVPSVSLAKHLCASHMHLLHGASAEPFCLTQPLSHSSTNTNTHSLTQTHTHHERDVVVQLASTQQVVLHHSTVKHRRSIR